MIVYTYFYTESLRIHNLFLSLFWFFIVEGIFGFYFKISQLEISRGITLAIISYAGKCLQKW